MRRLPVLILIAAFVCAAAYGAARPQPAAALGYVDLRVKQNVLLLRGYIDTQAARHGFLYPTKSEVRKGGGLSAPVWPVNPWTGKPMAPGSGRGTYAYTPAADRHSYTLVAHFSKGGTYKVTGGSPGWLATERATAASDLAAAQAQLATSQTDLATAKDAEAELGARVIKGYIEWWGVFNNATAPLLADISPAGVGAGQDFWPTNPWTGADMALGTGAGDFSYSRGTDGVAYGLTAHTAAGSVDLSGSVPQVLRNATDTLRNELVKVNTEYLRAVVDRYALDNNDEFPPSLSKVQLGTYAFDYWPKNPWTWTDMQSSPNQGGYTYTVTTDYDYSYQIAGHLSDGTDYLVDDYWATHFLGMRERFKDLVVEGHAQVLKDYVDEWKLTHGGALPTVDEMTPTGAVGLAHTWWPLNPWTNGAMTPGAFTGGYEYAPNGDGSFTLLVHQGPFPPFTETYTAQ